MNGVSTIRWWKSLRIHSLASTQYTNVTDTKQTDTAQRHRQRLYSFAKRRRWRINISIYPPTLLWSNPSWPDAAGSRATVAPRYSVINDTVDTSCTPTGVDERRNDRLVHGLSPSSSILFLSSSHYPMDELAGDCSNRFKPTSMTTKLIHYPAHRP